LEQGAQPQQKPAEDAKRRSTRKAPQAAYFFPEKDTGKQQWDEPAQNQAPNENVLIPAEIILTVNDPLSERPGGVRLLTLQNGY
jgi:hypothetical protein